MKTSDRLLDVRVSDVQPLLLDANAASRLLSVSQRTLWSMTAPRGPIRTARLGKLHRYSLAELERFVAERLAASAPAAE